MLVAIGVLFALYLTNKPKEKSDQGTITRTARNNRRMARNVNTRGNAHNETSHPAFKCSYHFGFLRNRKDKGVPEECTGCDKLVNCMFSTD